MKPNNYSPITRVCDVASLPYDSRPLSRIVSYGESALSTDELLTVILGSKFIFSSDNLSSLMNMSYHELKHSGLSSQQSIKIIALRELSKRIFCQTPSVRYNSPEDIAGYLSKYSLLDHEEFHLLCLDSGNHLIKDVMLTSGTENSSLVSVRETLTAAIRIGASSAIVSHNHPSGNPFPSEADENVTRQLKNGFLAVNIQFLDHIIIGESGFYSFRNEGRL